MTTDHSFRSFELAGWEDETTAAEYDRHLSLVTTQSVEALLDDASLRSLKLWSTPSDCAISPIPMWLFAKRSEC